MRAQKLPAAAGWRWIRGGFDIFRRNPPALGLLVITYWFIMLFLKMLPVVGPVLASLVIPGLSVGLMQACRELERGESASFQTLFSGLKENPRTLVLLGAVYLLCGMAALGLVTVVDGGEFLRAMESAQSADNTDSIDKGGLLLSLAAMVLLFLPLLMAFWYAPVLAAWHRTAVLKSLFFSFVACLLNWRAFFVYCLSLVLVGVVLPSLALSLLLAIFPSGQNFLASMLTVPVVLVLAPTIFASFYVSYRDVFTISDSA